MSSTLWKPGQSGNPSGRPKVNTELRAKARAHTDAAINALVEVLSSKKASPSARVMAANSLLDRGYGRPESSLTALIETPPEAPPSDFDFSKLASEEIATMIALFEKAKVEPEAGTDRAVN